MKPNDDKRTLTQLNELIDLCMQTLSALIQLQSELEGRLKLNSTKQIDPGASVDSPDRDRYDLPTSSEKEWKEDHHIDTWRRESGSGV